MDRYRLISGLLIGIILTAGVNTVWANGKKDKKKIAKVT